MKRIIAKSPQGEIIQHSVESVQSISGAVDDFLSGPRNPFPPSPTPTPTMTATPSLTPTATRTPTTSAFTSLAAQDGWLLESSETGNTGGTLNKTVRVVRLGDDASNRQYRAILSFNTGPLPDNAVITSVTLKIRQNGAPVGANPFDVLGNLWVDVRNGFFGSAPALQRMDFNAPATAARVGAFNRAPANGWYTVTLNTAGRSSINKTALNGGLTQSRLYFAKDDNNNHAADFIKFLSGNASGARPLLVITYTLP